MGLKLLGSLLSPAYGDHIREATQKPIILGMLEEREKVLDAGSGSGFYTQHVKAGQTIALDYSLENVKKAGMASQSQMVNGDAQKLPFKAASFDGVLCLEVLEHLNQDLQALKEIKRVMQKKGALILSVPLKPAPIKDTEHVREGYTPEELEKMLKQEGLKKQSLLTQ